MAPLVSGSFDGWTFQADSSLVAGVFPQPNHSGDNGVKPGAFGVHDIECPPAVKQAASNWFGRLYASLFGPDYLQNPAEQHSVQYGIFGNVILQGIPESWWAWGMGTPCSRYTTHVEQSGYASFTEAQWRGRASAIGTTFSRASDGVVVTYTAEMAEAMSTQFTTMATLYADWCKRNGYIPKLGTLDELIRTTQGEKLGILFTHAMASQVPNTTTYHTDPGSNYPVQGLVDLALQIFLGVNPTPTPPAPSSDWMSDFMSGNPTQAQVDDFWAKSYKSPMGTYAYSAVDAHGVETQQGKAATLGQLLGATATFSSRSSIRSNIAVSFLRSIAAKLGVKI